VSSCWTKGMDQPFCRLIDGLIILRSARESCIHDTWRRRHCWSRSTKFRPMFGAQGLWARKDLYRATPALTQSLGSTGLIRRPAPFSQLLRHTRRCWELSLTRILKGDPFTEKSNLASISNARVARQDIYLLIFWMLSILFSSLVLPLEMID
jgi:hypothetical protein